MECQEPNMRRTLKLIRWLARMRVERSADSGISEMRFREGIVAWTPLLVGFRRFQLFRQNGDLFQHYSPEVQLFVGHPLHHRADHQFFQVGE